MNDVAASPYRSIMPQWQSLGTTLDPFPSEILAAVVAMEKAVIGPVVTGELLEGYTSFDSIGLPAEADDVAIQPGEIVSLHYISSTGLGLDTTWAYESNGVRGESELVIAVMLGHEERPVGDYPASTADIPLLWQMAYSANPRLWSEERGSNLLQMPMEIGRATFGALSGIGGAPVGFIWRVPLRLEYQLRTEYYG